MTRDERREMNRKCLNAWRAANPDKVREQRLRSYKANAEARRAGARKARADNLLAARARDAKFRKANPEGIKMARRKYNQRHRDRILESSRRRYAENAETNRAQARDWYARNRDRILARIRHKKYGLTEEQVQTMCDRQQGKCACCQERLTETLAVDHDHATNLIRGLLCKKCNLAIGLSGDSPSRLRAMADYLEIPARAAVA